MRRELLVLGLGAAALALAVPLVLGDGFHGGGMGNTRRRGGGPGGTAPPPPPPPPPVKPPSTPPIPGTTGANPPGATTGGSPYGPTTPKFVPQGATTGGGAQSETGLDRWEVWWWYNADAYLDLRSRRLAERPQTLAPESSAPGAPRARDVATLLAPGEFEERILPSLLEGLKAEPAEIADSSALAIGRSLPRDEVSLAFDGLKQALQHQENSVKEAAALAFGLIGHSSARPLLLELLRDTPEGRRLAHKPDNVPLLVRAYAALALGTIGSLDDVSALQAIIDHAKDSDKDLAACALLALGMMRSDDVIPYLLEVMERPNLDRTVRAFAPIAVGKMEVAEAADLALDRLLYHVRNSRADVELARSCAIAIGRLAPITHQGAADTLCQIINACPDSQCRHFATIALAEMGHRDAAFSEQHTLAHDRLLRLLLTDVCHPRRATQRPWAALALGLYLSPLFLNLGTTSRPQTAKMAAQKLMEALDDSNDPSHKAAIAVGLGWLQAKESAPSLLKLLDELSDPTHLGAVALALALMGHDDAAPRLREMIRPRGTDWFLRRDLARALAMLADESSLDILLELLARSTTQHEGASLALALGFLGDRRAVQPLLEILNHPRRAAVIRGMAAESLGILAEKTLLPWRTRILADHNYRAEVDAVSQMVEWN
ncbi:MAG: HEAT repeat domain-containing protein [Planctomycetota bacterium]